MDKGWQGFDVTEIGFKEQYELFQYVTEVLGQKAIIIDYDELVHNPG